VAICLERVADLHMAQLMPLPLTVSCFSEIQIGFTFPVPAHPGSPGKRAVKRVCSRRRRQTVTADVIGEFPGDGTWGRGLSHGKLLPITFTATVQFTPPRQTRHRQHCLVVALDNTKPKRPKLTHNAQKYKLNL